MGKEPDPSEERSLRQQVKAGVAECPRCGYRLAITPVPPRSDLAYVRDRALLSCTQCGFRAVVDKK